MSFSSRCVAWRRNAWRSPLAVVVVTITTVLMVGSTGTAAPDGTPHYPDLQSIVPSNDIHISVANGRKELNYTHHIYNAGPGPLEIRPVYDPATDAARGYQRVLTHDATGNWGLFTETPIDGLFFWHAPHNHYHFPLSDYGLFAANSDGSVGAPVATTPKIGFCIGDNYLLDRSLPHAPLAVGYDGGTCGDPTAMRGISVGWSDKYDWNDIGQPIDITDVPDGVYWFRGIVDPNGYLSEADESNNTNDVKIRITGAVVDVLSPLSTMGSLAVDASAIKEGKGTITTGRLDTSGPTLLVAFVASDGDGVAQTAHVSGGGLMWSLVLRSNSQPGTSEIWTATAPAPLANATVTSTLTYGSYDQSLTVLALQGAAGVGASAGTSGSGGTPVATLITKGSGSTVLAVGNDSSRANLRSPGAGQIKIEEWVNLETNDTFWVQAQPSPAGVAGASVTFSAGGPSGDRWNVAAVEIVPAAPQR